MKKFLILLICLGFPLFGAGPVMHLYFAEKWCEKHGIRDEIQKRDFILGSLFPDIRYIAQFPREWSHPAVVEVKDVFNASTFFEAGMKFHVLIDIVRERFVEESNIYEVANLYAKGHSGTFLKMIEDEILLKHYDGRDCLSYFNFPIEEEHLFNVSDDHIHEWHQMIKMSLSFQPSWLVWLASTKEAVFGIPSRTLYKWSYLLPELAVDPIFENHVNLLLKKIEEFVVDRA